MFTFICKGGDFFLICKYFLELFQIFQIADAVGAFVEEEVHYGEAWDESVFWGEDLPVGSFESEVFQDSIRSFGVDGFAKVGDFMSLDGNRLPFACETDVGRNACLTQEKLEYLRVEVQHQLRAGIENGEEFVLVVFEIGGREFDTLKSKIFDRVRPELFFCSSSTNML